MSSSAKRSEAVKLALAESAEDLAAFAKRAKEPAVDFEATVRAMRRRGKL